MNISNISKHVECILLFSSSLSLIDIKTALDKTYPDELLSLKIKEIKQNTYEFKEYCHEYVDCRSFISFEFMKMICFSDDIMKRFKSDKQFFKFKIETFSLKYDNTIIQPENLKEYFNPAKTNDFFDEFLHDWKISFTNITKNKIPTFQSQIDSNKTSSLFENCYDIVYGIRIMHNSMRKHHITQVLSTFYSKTFQINQIRKNIFDITDAMDYCSNFENLDLILLIKLAQQNLLGFKLLNFYYKTTEQTRTKWIKSDEVPFVKFDEKQDLFEKIIKEKQIVEIENCKSYSVRFTTEISYEILISIFKSIFDKKLIEIKKIGRNNYELIDTSENDSFDYASFIIMCKNKINACELQTVCVKEANQKRWKWIDAENVSIQYDQQDYEKFVESFKFFLLLPQKADRQIQLSCDVLKIQNIHDIVKTFESKNNCKPNLIFPNLTEILDADIINTTNDTVEVDETKPTNTLKHLTEITKFHCSNGVWNFDKYMHGLTNGLLLAEAIIKEKNPEFLLAPEQFLIEKKHENLIEVINAETDIDNGRGRVHRNKSNKKTNSKQTK